MSKFFPIIVLLTLGAACTEQNADPTNGQNGAETPRDAASDTGIPEGAIKIGEDYYMVPAGKDSSGCPWFRPYSQTKMVAQVMYYRDGEGGFTASREEADCPPLD